MPISIAVDGPVGAGKTTICDAVCKELGILHLDTGAMYRAVGISALRKGVSTDDEDSIVRLLTDGEIDIDVEYRDGEQITLVNGENVNGLIRTQEAGSAASAVSRFPGVRRHLVALQQAMAKRQSMLLDGRDIGTVVLPDADVKIYLTASSRKRAERRRAQLLEAGTDIPLEEIIREVEARDHQDMNRETDPLRRAEDAVVVDSSDLTFEETVEQVLSLIKAAKKE
ncbi:MAG: (d)CMP kinase [Clostridia bacterium]|nr:(d)CMP kinase [Clostridia bacterium]